MSIRRFAYSCFAAALFLVAIGLGVVHLPSPHASASSPTSTTTFDPANATTTPGYDSIVRVVDGDTFIVWKDGEEVTVRVMGIDTPEVVDPRKPVECFGPEASAEGKHLLTGQAVKLVPDPTGDAYDMYGRMLAYVYLPAQAGLPSGLFYNDFMIRNGYAHEYTFKKPYEFQKQFRAAQAAAKSAHLGLWSPDTCNGDTGVNSTEPTAKTVAQ